MLQQRGRGKWVRGVSGCAGGASRRRRPAAATTHAPPAAGRRRLQGRCTCDCRVRALLPARRLLLLPATRLLQRARCGRGPQVVSVCCRPAQRWPQALSPNYSHALTCWAPHSPALLCCTLPPACLCVCPAAASKRFSKLCRPPEAPGTTPGSSERVAGLAQVSQDALFRTVGECGCCRGVLLREIQARWRYTGASGLKCRSLSVMAVPAALGLLSTPPAGPRVSLTQLLAYMLRRRPHADAAKERTDRCPCRRQGPCCRPSRQVAAPAHKHPPFRSRGISCG